MGYYDHENSTAAEEMIDIPHDRAIIVGPDYVSIFYGIRFLQDFAGFRFQCRDIEPPLGKSNDLLFGVKTHGKVWHVCADDKDDLM